MHESQIAQLEKLESQIRDIKGMIVSDVYCIDILTRIRSVSRSLSKVEYTIFKNHLESCVRKSFSEGTLFDKNRRIDEVQDFLARAR